MNALRAIDGSISTESTKHSIDRPACPYNRRTIGARIYVKHPRSQPAPLAQRGLGGTSTSPTTGAAGLARLFSFLHGWLGWLATAASSEAVGVDVEVMMMVRAGQPGSLGGVSIKKS